MSSNSKVLSFFFGEFHEGWVNRILHFIGFVLFIVGMWEMNWLLVVVGILFMEGGHFYLFITRFKGKIPVNITHLFLTQFGISIITFVLIGMIVYSVKSFLYGSY